MFIFYLCISVNNVVMNKCGTLHLNGFRVFDKEKMHYYIQNTKKPIPTINTRAILYTKTFPKVQ